MAKRVQLSQEKAEALNRAVAYRRICECRNTAHVNHPDGMTQCTRNFGKDYHFEHAVDARFGSDTEIVICKDCYLENLRLHS